MDLLPLLAPEVRGRVLVVAAHPDDETVGAGGLVCRAVDPWIVHLTDGAPRDPRLRSGPAAHDRDAYRAARQRELDVALAHAGVGRARVWTLALPDQEAAHALVEAAHRLEERIGGLRPRWIVTHPYEGGHPDHDAAAFATWAACARLARRGRPSGPRVEMTSYHLRGGELRTGVFLPSDEPVPHVRCTHPPSLRERKRAMLDAFASQRAVLAPFGDEAEELRVAPSYRFDRPPHDPPLLYEALGWTMTSAAFSTLAVRAARRLGLPVTEVSAWG